MAGPNYAEQILVDGTRTIVTPQNPAKGFTLRECYEHTHSDIIQIGQARDGRIIIMDEEGKVAGKPINHAATELYIHGHLDPIVGDVIVTPKGWFK